MVEYRQIHTWEQIMAETPSLYPRGEPGRPKVVRSPEPSFKEARSRFFNTTGPCQPDRHYMLAPKERLVGAQLDRYIRDELFWVLHAPRQTGKTSFLLNWTREINESGTAVACYVTVEHCQGLTDIAITGPAICQAIIRGARLTFTPEFVPIMPAVDPADQIGEILMQWAGLVAPMPLVVLFDEVDTLQDQPMVSFLRQLRAGFANRGPGRFPVSVALVGMRDLRDYLIKSKDGVPINPGSPFNIKEDSASLSNFSREDVHRLIGQHVTEKAQPFETAAIDLIYDLTRGQPWLVNALAKKCVWNLVPEETREPVNAAHVMQAKELLIQERATHLDSLTERLKEARIKRVIETIMAGKTDITLGRADRDVELCFDLGLICWEDGLRIANPIYQEIIPRVLSQNMHDNIPAPEFRWKQEDGSIDMPALMREFQRFWRRNADCWEAQFDYLEVFPHLLVMAFLQRIINGGGCLDREYAAGRGRVDLAVEFGGRWTVIEIKMVHPQDGRESTIDEGLIQVARYRDRIGTTDAWLMVFDRRPEARARPWEERLTWETRDAPGGPVMVVGG